MKINNFNNLVISRQTILLISIIIIFILCIGIYQSYNQYMMLTSELEKKQNQLSQINRQQIDLKRLFPIYKQLEQKHLIYDESLKSMFYGELERINAKYQLNHKQINISALTKPSDKKNSLQSIDYEMNLLSIHDGNLLNWLDEIQQLRSRYIFSIQYLEIQRIESSQLNTGNLEIKCLIKLYIYSASSAK